eukprot:CAMPEP_0194384352 /NCGR_PEP_ID=MMETSP0174-20130528/73512_1 /TAXON_ID=216777 /ORGANISM="Proboscia alata, Strain PI-D3" /LENGTH=758 /DNA_ID=CAMNT_0039171467 /DNA_START=500 /DNA_END=2776 /DNA_ORIENTATION=+
MSEHPSEDTISSNSPLHVDILNDRDVLNSIPPEDILLACRAYLSRKHKITWYERDERRMRQMVESRVFSKTVARAVAIDGVAVLREEDDEHDDDGDDSDQMDHDDELDEYLDEEDDDDYDYLDAIVDDEMQPGDGVDNEYDDYKANEEETKKRPLLWADLSLEDRVVKSSGDMHHSLRGFFWDDPNELQYFDVDMGRVVIPGALSFFDEESYDEEDYGTTNTADSEDDEEEWDELLDENYVLPGSTSISNLTNIFQHENIQYFTSTIDNYNNDGERHKEREQDSLFEMDRPLRNNEHINMNGHASLGDTQQLPGDLFTTYPQQGSSSYQQRSMKLKQYYSNPANKKAWYAKRWGDPNERRIIQQNQRLQRNRERKIQELPEEIKTLFQNEDSDNLLAQMTEDEIKEAILTYYSSISKNSQTKSSKINQDLSTQQHTDTNNGDSTRDSEQNSIDDLVLKNVEYVSSFPSNSLPPWMTFEIGVPILSKPEVLTNVAFEDAPSTKVSSFRSDTEAASLGTNLQNVDKKKDIGYDDYTRLMQQLKMERSMRATRAYQTRLSKNDHNKGMRKKLLREKQDLVSAFRKEKDATTSSGSSRHQIQVRETIAIATHAMMRIQSHLDSVTSATAPPATTSTETTTDALSELITNTNLMLKPTKLKGRPKLLQRILLERYGLRGRCVPPIFATAVEREINQAYIDVSNNDEDILLTTTGNNNQKNLQLKERSPTLFLFANHCRVPVLGAFVLSKLLNERDNEETIMNT